MTITVHGVPLAQPRQRHRIVEANGKTFSQNYTPKKDPVNTYKATIRMAYRDERGQLHTGPVSVAVELYFPRPRSMCWKRREWTRAWHTKKPDCDNTIKAIFDALKNVAWRDDAQICCLTVMKFVCGREAPQTVVRIQEMKKG